MQVQERTQFNPGERGKAECPVPQRERQRKFNVIKQVNADPNQSIVTTEIWAN